MKKTKIICTIGPSTNTKEKIKALINAGMDCARFNFSHGTHESQKEMIDLVKSARRECGKSIAILLDTKGPEIRVRLFENGSIILKTGQKFVLDQDENTLGNEERISITYKELYKHIKKGTHILVDDGAIELKVSDIVDDKIVTTVIHGGKLSNRKSINVPNVPLPMVYLSEQDKKDIIFGIKNDVDFIAASFVRSAQDVKDLREFLDTHGGQSIEIISKIENTQGVKNFKEILKYTDGVMVARGDLGVEISFKEIPAIQKNLIDLCNEKGKIVIVATQMLESMVNNPRPTRAEVSDIANAVFDGATGIMLSGESANGKYPIQAVKTMANIAMAAEKTYRKFHYEGHLDLAKDFTQTMCLAAYEASEHIKADAIVVLTETGHTAKRIAAYKPQSKVVSVTVKEKGHRQLALYYDVVSIPGKDLDDFAALIEMAKEYVLKTGQVKKGDTVVLVSGSFPQCGYTDTVRIYKA